MILVLCLAAAAAEAQVPGITVTTEPGLPTVTTPVTIVIRSTCACPSHLTPISRNGFTFDVPHTLFCLSACGPDSVVQYDVGLLEPGVYTVRQYPEGDPGNTTVIGTFAVATATIPATGSAGTIAIVVALSLIALAMMRR